MQRLGGMEVCPRGDQSAVWKTVDNIPWSATLIQCLTSLWILCWQNLAGGVDRCRTAGPQHLKPPVMSEAVGFFMVYISQKLHQRKTGFGSVVLLNVLGCLLTYWGQAETNAWAWFNKSLRPLKPEGSLGQTAQDGHLDSHTAPELVLAICS